MDEEAKSLLERITVALETLADTYEMMFECQRIATERSREAMEAAASQHRGG